MILRGYWGHVTNDVTTKTRLTQKLQWIALKILLMKAEIDKSNQVDIICAIKCDYLVITVIT